MKRLSKQKVWHLQWVWDNIYLSKDERRQYLYLNVLLAIFISIKAYMMLGYTPAVYPLDPQLLASVQIVELEQKPRAKKYRPAQEFAQSGFEKPTKADDSKKERKSKTDQKERYSTKKTAPPATFPFDPNKVSRDSLKQLGLSRYTINSLLKYRSKGGKIRSKEQFGKFNGLDEETLARLLPMLEIEERKFPKKTWPKKDHKNSTAVAHTSLPRKVYKKKNPVVIDINTADTTAWQSLYGIGSVYSKRIVKYRDYVGGFFTTDQVKEVWGISDSLYQTLTPYLTVQQSTIARRNINLMTKEDLGKHPYIGWKKAKHILNYKRSHGDYKEIDDLSRLHLLSPADVDTIKLYFDVK